MQQEITQLSQTLAAQLGSRQLTLATAESCTGGGIGTCLTDLAGSSRWFMGGIISYSNAAKVKLLGVEEHLLQQHGAVSEAVVKQMAVGAIDSFNSDYAMAVSGVAGPDGGSEDKPVGTVWIAWAYKTSDYVGSNRAEANKATTNTLTYQQQFCFAGDRHAVRQQTVKAALAGLVDILSTDYE